MKQKRCLHSASTALLQWKNPVNPFSSEKARQFSQDTTVPASDSVYWWGFFFFPKKKGLGSLTVIDMERWVHSKETDGKQHANYKLYCTGQRPCLLFGNLGWAGIIFGNRTQKNCGGRSRSCMRLPGHFESLP